MFLVLLLVWADNWISCYLNREGLCPGVRLVTSYVPGLAYVSQMVLLGGKFSMTAFLCFDMDAQDYATKLIKASGFEFII